MNDSTPTPWMILDDDEAGRFGVYRIVHAGTRQHVASRLTLADANAIVATMNNQKPDALENVLLAVGEGERTAYAHAAEKCQSVADIAGQGRPVSAAAITAMADYFRDKARED